MIRTSSPNDAKEAEIDSRVLEMLSMEPEDPQTLFDLRETRSTKGHTKFQAFWDEAAKFIDEYVGTAVDDRRHTTITHLAKAISIRDFRDQVAARLPEGALIPSEEWLRLQFWPKSPETKLAFSTLGTTSQVHGPTTSIPKITPRRALRCHHIPLFSRVRIAVS